MTLYLIPIFQSFGAIHCNGSLLSRNLTYFRIFLPGHGHRGGGDVENGRFGRRSWEGRRLGCSVEDDRRVGRLLDDQSCRPFSLAGLRRCVTSVETRVEGAEIWEKEEGGGEGAGGG